MFPSREWGFDSPPGHQVSRARRSVSPLARRDIETLFDVDESREKVTGPSTVSFAKLLGASLFVGVVAAALCALAWLIACWLKL